MAQYPHFTVVIPSTCIKGIVRSTFTLQISEVPPQGPNHRPVKCNSRQVVGEKDRQQTTTALAICSREAQRFLNQNMKLDMCITTPAENLKQLVACCVLLIAQGAQSPKGPKHTKGLPFGATAANGRPERGSQIRSDSVDSLRAHRNVTRLHPEVSPGLRAMLGASTLALGPSGQGKYMCVCVCVCVCVPFFLWGPTENDGYPFGTPFKPPKKVGTNSKQDREN